MSHELIQFNSELDRTLSLDPNSSLDQLDGAFNHSIQSVSSALDSCLSDEDSLNQTLSRLSHSPIFRQHSQRMTGILLTQLMDPQTTPSSILVACNLLLQHGFENQTFFRILRNFSLPLANSHTIVGTPSQSTQNNIVHTLLRISYRMGLIPSTIAEAGRHRRSSSSIVDVEIVPGLKSIDEKQAERRLGPVLAGLLYELCRVQKLDPEMLEAFNETLIGNLFELVKLTRDSYSYTYIFDFVV